MLIKKAWLLKMGEGCQWKGINRKQNTRWQHLSQLKTSVFFSLQNFFSCYETQQLILETGTAIWWVTEPHWAGRFVLGLFIKDRWPRKCWGKWTTKFCNNAKHFFHNNTTFASFFILHILPPKWLCLRFAFTYFLICKWNTYPW
jgi:hypothetical protein